MIEASKLCICKRVAINPVQAPAMAPKQKGDNQGHIGRVPINQHGGGDRCAQYKCAINRQVRKVKNAKGDVNTNRNQGHRHADGRRSDPNPN